MRVRRALISDVVKLFELESEIFSYENFPLSRGSFYYHVKNSLLYLAEIEGQIVGYILVLTKRKIPKIYSLGVSPAFRKRGISHTLITNAMQTLSRQGAKSLSLEVRSDNQNAIAIYKDLQFEKVREIPSFYRDNCSAYVMKKNF